jgi:hypothetical protein
MVLLAYFILWSNIKYHCKNVILLVTCGLIFYWDVTPGSTELGASALAACSLELRCAYVFFMCERMYSCVYACGVCVCVCVRDVHLCIYTCVYM